MPPVKEDEKSLKEKLRAKALDMYENELHVPPALDLGLKSGSRSQLRVVCRTVVLESSQITKRKYSHSNLSSGEWSNKGDDKNTDDAITRLRSLQKERLIISRMGFADRAKQLDVEIEEMRVKAADAKAAREQTLLQENLEILERKMNRKKDRMEVIMNSETVKLEQALNKEFRKMRNRCVIPLSFSFVLFPESGDDCCLCAALLCCFSPLTHLTSPRSLTSPPQQATTRVLARARKRRAPRHGQSQKV